MTIRFPRRLSDPLAPARNYVALRAGMGDAQRSQRRLRELQRQPRPDPGTSLQVVGAAPLDSLSLETDQIYRANGDPGIPDALFVRIKGADDETTLEQLALQSQLPTSHSHTATTTVTTVTTNFAILAGNVGTADVFCQAGTVCTGGGASSNGAAGTVWVHSTLPTPAGNGNGWRGAIFNNGGGTVTMTVWARCLGITIT